jgi:hypothetical protein
VLETAIHVKEYITPRGVSAGGKIIARYSFLPAASPSATAATQDVLVLQLCA